MCIYIYMHIAYIRSLTHTHILHWDHLGKLGLAHSLQVSLGRRAFPVMWTKLGIQTQPVEPLDLPLKS